MRGGNQAAHIDHAAAAEVHAVAIADDDLAGRRDAAQNGAGFGARHAVEGGCAAAGLVELHLGARTDVEALPIDDGALAGLVNDHVGATAADAGLAGCHAGTVGQSSRRQTLGPNCGR